MLSGFNGAWTVYEILRYLIMYVGSFSISIQHSKLTPSSRKRKWESEKMRNANANMHYVHIPARNWEGDIMSSSWNEIDLEKGVNKVSGFSGWMLMETQSLKQVDKYYVGMYYLPEAGPACGWEKLFKAWTQVSLEADAEKLGTWHLKHEKVFPCTVCVCTISMHSYRSFMTRGNFLTWDRANFFRRLSRDSPAGGGT
jgi:hypothetical protein